ncbi:hypothetical protein [Kineococcus glutinatus]
MQTDLDLDDVLDLAREVGDLQEAIRAAVYRAAARTLGTPTVTEDWERAMELARDPEHQRQLHLTAAAYAQAVGLDPGPMSDAAGS